MRPNPTYPTAEVVADRFRLRRLLLVPPVLLLSVLSLRLARSMTMLLLLYGMNSSYSYVGVETTDGIVAAVDVLCMSS